MQRPCDLADLAPPDSRRFITDAALSHLDALQEHGGLLQHPLYEHLCQELADDLAERLQAGRYTGNLACTLLGLLIANAPTIAAPACRQLPVGSSPELAEAARRGQAQLEPATVVDKLAAVDADAVGLAEIVPHLNVLKLETPPRDPCPPACESVPARRGPAPATGTLLFRCPGGLPPNPACRLGTARPARPGIPTPRPGQGVPGA